MVRFLASWLMCSLFQLKRAEFVIFHDDVQYIRYLLALATLCKPRLLAH